MHYMGVENCLRVLLLRQEWCEAFARFDIRQERQTPGTLWSGDLAEHFCPLYVPGYSNMPENEREEAAEVFLTTDQTCKRDKLQNHQPTVLLLLEGGIDAFQPFKRKVHSTWVAGTRCGISPALHALLTPLLPRPQPASLCLPSSAGYPTCHLTRRPEV